MERNQGRRLRAEEKLRIVEEGRVLEGGISEVCRRHQISRTQFYRWERIAKEGALEALRNGGRVKKSKRDEWLMTEINRLRAVVAEITKENLSLKRGLLV